MRAFENGLRFTVEEMCCKMGIVLPGCTVNYPSNSLMRIFCIKNEADLCRVISAFCKTFSAAYGETTAAPSENGWSFTLSAQAVANVMHSPIGGAFLQDVCSMNSNCHASIEQWKAVFDQHGDAALQRAEDAEYDWILYYPSQKPVSFVYCFKQAGKHLSYHRLEREDFEELFGKIK